MCSIEGDDDNVSVNTIFDACCIHCVHCAICFIIVVAYNYIELAFIRFNEGFHNLLSAILCEITGLGIKNLPFAVLFCNFVEAFGTSQCCGSAYSTFNHKNVCFLAIQVFCQPVTCCNTFVLCVGTYPCIIHRSVCCNLTVSDDHRDACILCFLKYCIPSCCLNRSNYDIVKLLCNKVTNCFQLCCVVVIAVDQAQFISVCFAEYVLVVLRIGCTPVRFMSNLCITNCNYITACCRCRCLSVVCCCILCRCCIFCRRCVFCRRCICCRC